MRLSEKPEWLKKRLPSGSGITRVERVIARHGLHTVCLSAKCPNRNDCYQQGTATFLIMGDACTRGCAFCSIAGGRPAPLDREEPQRLAAAAAAMGLRYVVVTSVTRDDLPDGGASHFAAVARALKERIPEVRVEVLVPDFRGDSQAVDTVLAAGPAVFNHNVETVPSLYPRVRPKGDFERSLSLLRHAGKAGAAPVKSGLMLGLGEQLEEVAGVLRALRGAGVSMVTVGQYLRPAKGCLEVVEFVTPGTFRAVAGMAADMGFAAVAAGPFVRSSFEASRLAAQAGVTR